MNLAKWFSAAIAHGRVYYVAHVARSNMQARYTLYTISLDGQLLKAWPSSEAAEGYDAKLAKALGFSLKKRAWVRHGCGYNRVHSILSDMSVILDMPVKSLPSDESLHDS